LASDFVVNVQGDEPLMHPDTIDQVVQSLKRDKNCVMSTACIAKSDAAGYRNPNVVKVVKDRRGVALYFSRSPIPCDREGDFKTYFKHLGIYGYRRNFLLAFPTLPPSPLESREKLEQLRALENGYVIRVVETTHDSIGVDTEDDFERVKDLISSQTSVEATHA